MTHYNVTKNLSLGDTKVFSFSWLDFFPGLFISFFSWQEMSICLDGKKVVKKVSRSVFAFLRPFFTIKHVKCMYACMCANYAYADVIQRFSEVPDSEITDFRE